MNGFGLLRNISVLLCCDWENEAIRKWTNNLSMFFSASDPTAFHGPNVVVLVWLQNQVLFTYLFRPYINHSYLDVLKIIDFRVNKISSIADLFSLRYGNRSVLGALVTNLHVGICYGLQLKIFRHVSYRPLKLRLALIFSQTLLLMFVCFGFFASYYGTRYVDASKRSGRSLTVAMESILKLVFFGYWYLCNLLCGTADVIKASVLRFIKNTISGPQWDQLVLFLCCFYVCYFLVPGNSILL
jgi:hypothetical protein